MGGRPWILPPEGLVIQSGGLLTASGGRGVAECCQGPRKRHGAGHWGGDHGRGPTELVVKVQRSYQNRSLARVPGSWGL